MILHIENLGPVKTADIDLNKDLILFTGPNNTGKTYVAWAIYGLGKFVPEMEGVEVPEPLLSYDPAKTFSDEDSRTFNTSAAFLIGQARDLWTQQYALKIQSDFVAPPGQLTGVVLTATTDPSDARTIGTFTWSHPSHFSLYQDAFKLVTEAMEWPASASILRGMISSASAAMLGITEIFSADRATMSTLHGELVRNRARAWDQFSREAGWQARTQVLRNVMQPTPLPRAMMDVIYFYETLKDFRHQRSELADLADRLELDTLGGRLNVDELGGINFHPGVEKEAPSLPLHVSSGTVRSLSALVLYFRHVAKKGDRIIIDEPEMGLHPDNQRKVARVLAAAINRGIRVIMSTHSDYITREINNLIMLSKDAEKARPLLERYGYRVEDVLKPERVGVYLFGNNCAENIPIGPAGFAVKSIDREIDLLNQTASDIYFGLVEE